MRHSTVHTNSTVNNTMRHSTVHTNSTLNNTINLAVNITKRPLDREVDVAEIVNWIAVSEDSRLVSASHDVGTILAAPEAHGQELGRQFARQQQARFIPVSVALFVLVVCTCQMNYGSSFGSL